MIHATRCSSSTPAPDGLPGGALSRLGLALAAALPLFAAACSQATEAGTSGDEPLPDPAAEGVITPEEAAKSAQEGINASNAEAELQKLETELEGG